MLTAMPSQPYRELGGIQVSEAGPNPQYVRAIVDHFACKMGADAVVRNPAVPEKGTLEVTAIAYRSNLANRGARTPAATPASDLNSESHGPFAQFPEAEIIPATASDESPSSPASEPSGAASSSMPLPIETAAPIPIAPLAASPSPTLTATPSLTPTPSETPTPGPSPSLPSINGGADGELLPLSPSEIVPDEGPNDDDDDSDSATSPSTTSAAPASTGSSP